MKTNVAEALDVLRLGKDEEVEAAHCCRLVDQLADQLIKGFPMALDLGTDSDVFQDVAGNRAGRHNLAVLLPDEGSLNLLGFLW